MFLPIQNKFIGKFYFLSMQKYSSNVVEKCLEKGNEIMINKFIDEVSILSRALGKITKFILISNLITFFRINEKLLWKLCYAESFESFKC
jgi:hypothetical protein